MAPNALRLPPRLSLRLPLRLSLLTGLSVAMGVGTLPWPLASQTPIPLNPSIPFLDAAQAQQPLNPDLKVGIIQRFGTKPTDKIEIKANPGEKLTLQFKTEGKLETLSTAALTLDIQPQVLPTPVILERVVLSTHRSFESAEDSANQWKAKGIPVEVAQPERWEVWAKRDVYSTPVLRRLLIEDLHKQNYPLPFLDSRELPQLPKASFVVNGQRYNRDELTLTSSGRTTLINATPFPGTFRLQPNTYGTYTLVNNVPIEDYLRGVVPHEIGPKAPPTAIEAQAILARTYALRNLRRFAIDNYEMCADTQCQVYFGWKSTLPSTDRGIANTKGMVLTYNNELVDAVYSSTTGGVTASFTDVWNGTPRPYLRPVVDSTPSLWNLAQKPLSDEKNLRQFLSLEKGFNEAGWRHFRWRRPATLEKIKGDLQKYLKTKQHPFQNFTTVKSLQVTGRAGGGRVQKMRVQTELGAFDLEKDEVIRALDTPNSLLFYMDPILGADRKTLQGYTFVGGGLGHGVGLSQTGSYKLSELGWKSPRILAFYYPGSQLIPLSKSVTYWREPSPPKAPGLGTR
jgi:SpoIID/LytB domain protein